MGRFDGKVAVITGGARGQGRAHAVAFAREGADVVACDVADQLPTVKYPMASEADLAETERLVGQTGRRCVAVKADVRDLDQMRDVADRAMAELGRVDVLLANAGIATIADGSTLDLSWEQWQETIDTNLTGVWAACKAVVPHIITGGRGGAVVITSSTAGLKGMARVGHYVASKHGVVGLARTLAIELAPHRIRVNTVHPTGVNTPMVVNDHIQRALAEASASGGGTQNLLPVEMVEPEDIAAAIVWLCSDEARYVTGVSLPVDAGFLQA